jgi:hypothetical protein
MLGDKCSEQSRVRGDQGRPLGVGMALELRSEFSFGKKILVKGNSRGSDSKVGVVLGVNEEE